jgi:NhaP-type Na+/H+ or K+/H+ antiporter
MPQMLIDIMTLVGALCFGIVIGWATYGTLRRSQRTALTDLSTLVGAVGGAAVTTLFPAGNGSFGAYCIGLALGFFYYLNRATRPGAPDWLGEQPGGGARGQDGMKQPPGPPKERV